MYALRGREGWVVRCVLEEGWGSVVGCMNGEEGWVVECLHGEEGWVVGCLHGEEGWVVESMHGEGRKVE